MPGRGGEEELQAKAVAGRTWPCTQRTDTPKSLQMNTQSVCSPGCTHQHITSPSLLAWRSWCFRNNTHAPTWPRVCTLSSCSVVSGAKDLHLDLQSPALVPVVSLQHLLNPSTRSVDILSWLEEKNSTSKQGNVTKGHRNSAVGGRDCCKTKPVLNTDSFPKPWSYGS